MADDGPEKKKRGRPPGLSKATLKLGADVRHFRNLGLPDPMVAQIALGIPAEMRVTEAVDQRMRRAERTAGERPERDPAARQALHLAWRRYGEADGHEQTIVAYMGLVEAMKGVWQAEAARAYIVTSGASIDPEGQADAVIADLCECLEAAEVGKRDEALSAIVRWLADLDTVAYGPQHPPGRVLNDLEREGRGSRVSEEERLEVDGRLGLEVFRGKRYGPDHPAYTGGMSVLNGEKWITLAPSKDGGRSPGEMVADLSTPAVMAQHDLAARWTVRERLRGEDDAPEVFAVPSFHARRWRRALGRNWPEPKIPPASAVCAGVDQERVEALGHAMRRGDAPVPAIPEGPTVTGDPWHLERAFTSGRVAYTSGMRHTWEVRAPGPGAPLPCESPSTFRPRPYLRALAAEPLPCEGPSAFVRALAAQAAEMGNSRSYLTPQNA